MVPLLLCVIILLLLTLQLTVVHFWNHIETLEQALAQANERAPLIVKEGSQPAPSGDHPDHRPDSSWLASPSLRLVPGGVAQDLIHRKLFSSALHPFELRPFFHRSSLERGERQPDGLHAEILVSLTTIVTPERLEMLPLLAKRWGGHVSVTYRIGPGPQSAREQLQALSHFLKANQEAASLMDVHVVIDSQPFQFNLWRNIARLLSPARSVLAVDVDFVPDPALHSYIVDHWGDLSARMTSEKVVFVVPAFEIPEEHGGDEEKDSLPDTKAGVVGLYQQERLQMFHPTWFHGQGHTNYTRWLGAEAAYEVETYHFKYEPYYLAPQAAPFCDERFLGYGSNKCACVYELKAAGYSFWVLPQSFLVHRPHARDRRVGTSAREKENQLNMEVMRRFMKDMEVKYGYRVPDP